MMKNKNILLLEDSSFDADLILNTLENEELRWNCVVAKNKQEYIQLLNQRSFDLILCDYTIHGFSDLEALIIAKEKNIDVPFIYLSDIKNDKSGLKSLVEGASDFIAKEDLHRLAPSIEKAIKEHEEKIHLKAIKKQQQETLDTSKDILLKIDDNGIIILANQKAAALFKTSTRDIAGSHLSSYFSKDTYQIFYEELKKVLKTKEFLKTKIKANLLYESKRLEIAFNPVIETDNDEVKYINLCMLDLNWNELENTYFNYNMDLLFKNAPDALYIRDTDGYVIDMNPAAEALTMYSKEEIIGKHFIDSGIIAKDDQDLFLHLMEESNKGNANQSQELRILNKKKETLYIEKTAFPFHYKERKLVLGIARDITLRKEAEKKLKENERKFKALLQSTEDVVFLIDKNYRYKEIYGKGLTKLGINLDNYTNKTPVEVYNESVAQMHTSAFKKAFNGTFEVFSWTFLTPAGKRIFQTSLSPIFDENSQINLLVGIGRDITDLQEVLNELEKAKVKAEESDRLKSAFLANISHEIRTPMNGIMGFTQLLKDYDYDKEKQQEYLDIISGRAKHLLRIINDLIDISKIESNQIIINQSEVSINKSLKDLHLFFQAELQNRNKEKVNLILESNNKHECTTFTDKERLEQILSNLLDNAIKFTESGTIRFGCHYSDDNKIICYVKDEGVGIPADKQKIIFEPFRQIDNSITKANEGTGLGLTITKQLIEYLGGSIWVASLEGKGSSFYFSLPAIKSNIKRSSTSKQRNLKLNLQNKNVLIVEDDEKSRALLELILNPTKANLLVAESGKSALNFIKKKSPIDLILMDIRLPDINGLELTKKIKQLKPEIPIIAQTAYAMTTDKKTALNKGCDDYISKPIQKYELYQLIEKHTKQNSLNIIKRS